MRRCRPVRRFCETQQPSARSYKDKTRAPTPATCRPLKGKWTLWGQRDSRQNWEKTKWTDRVGTKGAQPVEESLVTRLALGTGVQLSLPCTPQLLDQRTWCPSPLLHSSGPCYPHSRFPRTHSSENFPAMMLSLSAHSNWRPGPGPLLYISHHALPSTGHSLYGARS